MAPAWNQFNVAISEWKEAPVTGSYCFTYDSVDYCFTSGEEEVGVEILNNASMANLLDHCYTTTLANVVIANRPFSSRRELASTWIESATHWPAGPAT